MTKKRRSFSTRFKAKVALEALKEQETINRIASRCEVLPVQVMRSAASYEPAGESEANLELMRRIDELYTDCPFYGSRQMRRALRGDFPTVHWIESMGILLFPRSPIMRKAWAHPPIFGLGKQIN